MFNVGHNSNDINTITNIMSLMINIIITDKKRISLNAVLQTPLLSIRSEAGALSRSHVSETQHQHYELRSGRLGLPGNPRGKPKMVGSDPRRSMEEHNGRMLSDVFLFE